MPRPAISLIKLQFAKTADFELPNGDIIEASFQSRR